MTQYDGTLNGLQFILGKGADGGSPYRKRSVRSNVPFQESQETRGQFNTRTDLRSVFQTDWSGGAFWYKPLLSSQSLTSYFTSAGLDPNVEPGNLVPTPHVAQVSSSSAMYARMHHPIMLSFDKIYYAEVDSNPQGLVKWDGSAFSTLTNDFGVTGRTVQGMCYDRTLATIFALFDNGQVCYVTPDSAGGTVIDIGDAGEGSNIFVHFGRLMVWNGDTLQEITDPLGSPAATTLIDDAMGPDMLGNMASAASDPVIAYESTRLSVPSSEGVYMVKNVNQEGMIQADISRMDRNQEGTDIRVPIASLPQGVACVDIMYHLGSVLFACVTDSARLFANDISLYGRPAVVFYQFNPENGLSTIGMIDGGENPSELPTKFLAAEQGNVFIGSTAKVWVYDVVRGGVHPVVTSGFTAGELVDSMVWSTNASGQPVWQFTQYGQTLLYQRPTEDEIDSTQTPYLESNYFDFNIPAEKKTITHITLMTDGIDAGDSYTVTVEVDDAGSWSTGATFTSTSAKTQRVALATPLTGHRFRYKIQYATTGSPRTTPPRVKGLVLYAFQGELVRQWTLNISAAEAMNIGNARQNPDTVITALETLQALETEVTYVDSFRTSTAVTSTVRVDGVDIIKSSKAEADVIQVILTEVVQ